MELLMQGARTLERRIERNVLEDHRLTYPQFCVLEVVLEAAETMSMGELADTIRTSRGNISGIVDKLQHRGWVTRTQSEEDRRMYYVALADGRADLVASIVTAVHAQSPKWPATVRACLTQLVRGA